MEKRLSETYFLSAGETDAEGELALTVLTAKIIDIATAHANSLGIGNPAMSDRNAGWVLSRLAIEMERYPKVNETYTLTTWVEEWNRHFSERIISVTDAAGKAVGYARTIWMVISTETHESVGLSHLDLPAELIVGPGECPAAGIGRFPAVIASVPEGSPLPRGHVTANTPTVRTRFLYSDLDSYRHVNTVRYVARILDQFPLERYDSERIHRLELAFIHESRFGHELDILRHDEGEISEMTFRRLDKESTAVLAARVRFCKRYAENMC